MILSINSSNVSSKQLRQALFFISVISSLFFSSCQVKSPTSGVFVTNNEELKSALNESKPGDYIIMKNGVWEDVNIRFTSNGTDKKRITLRAETPGKVIITGKSDLKLNGEHLVVNGLHFRDGHSPSRAVIEFKHDDKVANHCRITECAIVDFNKPKRSDGDRWVQFHGRHNQMDRCYLAGKSNRGPTVRIDLAGNENINNYHKIIKNHFGPRPPKGGPSAETIQIGNSYTSVCPSYTLVADNLFNPLEIKSAKQLIFL